MNETTVHDPPRQSFDHAMANIEIAPAVPG